MAKIMCDVDDVLVHFVPVLNNWYNKEYRTSCTWEEYKSYVFSNVWKISKKEANNIVNRFIESRNFLELPIIKDSFECLSYLKDHHELEVVTSRTEDLKDVTTLLIKREFPLIFNEINFSKNYYINNNGKSKSEICKERGADFLIEDSKDYALQCADAGIKVLLLKRPWNNQCLHPLIIPCRSWKQVFTYFYLNEQREKQNF
ncbi:MAG: hypothetical protein AABW65_02885 [Nanoarchaeota archaeon]